MKKVLIYLMRFGLQMIYAVLKLLPTKKNKVVFLSRQSDTLTPDFEMVQQELRREDPQIEIVTDSKAREAADSKESCPSRARPCGVCIIWRLLPYASSMPIGRRFPSYIIKKH